MAVLRKQTVRRQQQQVSTNKRKWESWESYVESRRRKSRLKDESSDVPPGFEEGQVFSSSSPQYLQYLLYFEEEFTVLGFKSLLEPGQDFYFQFVLSPFQDKEVEETYTALRLREKRSLLHGYAFNYSKVPEFGQLVLQQRRFIVDWMGAICKAREVQYETLFLGVTLLDQFLARGFFKTPRALQLLGIACLTLASRIEENQSLVGRLIDETYVVGENEYFLSEVVGMEWLVMKVLKYRCCLPTVYNFLGYYLKAAKADASLETMAKHMAVLALSDHRLPWYLPSTTAAALVILASLALSPETSSSSSCGRRVMETHLRSRNDDLPYCLNTLEVWLDKFFHFDVLFAETDACAVLAAIKELADKSSET